MMSNYLLIHLIVILFFLTNIDNIILIFSFLALPSSRRGVVILSYIVCMLILLGILMTIYLTTRKMFVIPGVRYIGFLPIAMGIGELTYAMYEKFKRQKQQSVTQKKVAGFYDEFGINLTSQLAVSVDSLALFLPILLKCKDESAAIFCVTLLVLVVCVSATCLFIGRHLNLKWLDNISSKLMPWLLIAVGIYVIYF